MNHLLSLVLCMLVLLTAWLTPARAEGAATTAEGACQLTLAGALPNKKALVVHLDLRGGKIAAAFATAPTFNRAWQSVDASGLKLADGKLAGTLAVTIHSDGYIPKDGATVACTYAIDADLGKAGSFTGKYGAEAVQGAVTTAIAPRPSLERGHLNLTLENGIQFGETNKGGARRIRLSAGLDHGKAFSPKLDPPGSLVDVSFAAKTRSTDLAISPEGKVTGTLSAEIAPNEKGYVPFAYTFTGQLIGEMLVGDFQLQRGNDKGEPGQFLGTLDTAAVPAGDALYMITLNDAVGTGQFLRLHVVARGGKLALAFGTTPNFNNAAHTVDLSALKLEGNKIAGTVKLTINPDPWYPKDHKPFAASFELAATLTDREVAGTYSGTFGTREAKGSLDGETSLRPTGLVPAKAVIKLENGLTGGNEWQNRAFFGVEIDPAIGKITGGKVSNNHTKLSGTVTGGQVTLQDDMFTATFTATIDAGGNVSPGEYSFKATGVSLGVMNAGTFQTFREGQPLKTGTFWATVSPAK